MILEVIVIREKPEMKFHTTADYLDEEPIQKRDGLQLANSRLWQVEDRKQNVLTTSVQTISARQNLRL